MTSDDDMAPCDWTEVEVQFLMTFQVCKDHGTTRPLAASIESHGVNPLDLVAFMMATARDVIMHGMEEYPPLKEFIQQEHGAFGTLTEDEALFLVREFAHQYLVNEVLHRSYTHGLDTAGMIIPVTGEDDAH